MSITNERAVKDESERVIVCETAVAALSEVERLRRELAELRKPVEVLPVEVVAALDAQERACFERDDQCHWSLVWTTDMPLHPSKRFTDLRTAILKALNERGGWA